MDKLKNGLNQASGWMLYLSLLMLLALALPRTVFDPESRDFLLLIGIVGIWRYSMGALHFVRGMLFLYVVYPYYRRKVKKLGKDADPSHVFLLVTSFRIDALTTAMVYRSVIREAIDCGCGEAAAFQQQRWQPTDHEIQKNQTDKKCRPDQQRRSRITVAEQLDHVLRRIARQNDGSAAQSAINFHDQGTYAVTGTEIFFRNHVSTAQTAFNTTAFNDQIAFVHALNGTDQNFFAA